MKYTFAAVFLLLCTSVMQAQTMSQSFGNTSVYVSGSTAFEKIQLTGGNYFQKANLINSNDIMLPSYGFNGEGADNTYLSKDWVKGSVTKDNQTYSEGLVFMFDKVNRQLFFKQNNSADIMQADMSKVSVFSLVTDKQHIFIKGDLLNKDYTGEIFEIMLLNEKKFSLLKSILSVYEQPSGNSAAQAMTQTTSPGKYADHSIYYIYSNNILQQTDLKKKSLLKVLAPYELKAQSYMKNHKENVDEPYVIELLNFINQE